MIRSVFSLVLLCALGSTASLVAQIVPAPPATLAHFEVSQGLLQDLPLRALPRGCYEFRADLGGKSYTLRLWPHDVRAPGFVLYRDDGMGLTPMPTPASVTFRGTVLGMPGSSVAATVIAGDLEAIVRLDKNRSTWGIQALRRVDPGAAPGRCLVYDSRHLNAATGVCGVTAIGSPVAGVDMPKNVIAELACDADYDLYRKNNNSVTATQSDVTAVVNAVDLIFQRDVQVQYLVTAIIVRTQRIYTTSAPSTLLSQFGGHWRSQHRQIKRDVTHLFTGRNLSGSVIGIAYLGAICGGAYGLSQTRFSSNLVQRTGLTAHELGHNWSADHCSGGSCYIMCPGLGGCGRDVTRFNSGSVQSIVRHRNSVPCLATPGKPVLSSLAPASVLAFGGQTLLVNGQFLSDVVQVDVGTASFFKPDFEIVDDQTLRLDLPRVSALGSVPFSVHTLNQLSNALPLIYTAASPPLMKAPLLGGGGMPIRFEFAGQPAGDWYLLIAFGNQQVFPFLGSHVLATGFVLGRGTLDGSGFGATTVAPPMGALIGVTLYSQVVELGASGTAFTGATPLAATYLFY